ncbi:MAG: DNA-3-methyladenine glycosylase [Chitinophagaceae bacterium]|nr:DNA-3-methyladenine glycosylase [Chitinophagaceae bacterium]MCW5916259.1 DNA-3-methyladenine glycosylase [Ferruginibacter sp.]
MLQILPTSFFEGPDVVSIARELLGKIIETRIGGRVTSGRIVETEAYVAFTDKASHAFSGRRTPRNEDMYGPPGTSYVYICYGLHRMFNVVTNKAGIPDAVLVRAVEPVSGIPVMLKRSNKTVADASLTRGPGNTGRALGIEKRHSGNPLQQGPIRLLFDPDEIPDETGIGISTRIGVASSGADAMRPYRFFVQGNPYVSGPGSKRG